MSLPRLWTGPRIAKIAGLVLIGILQAATALAVAAAGSRILAGAPPMVAPGLDEAILAAAAAALFALRVLQRRHAEAFALDYVAQLRTGLIGHVIRLPEDAKQIRFGLVMTRVVNDLTAIKLWLASGLVSIIVSVAVLGPIAGYLAFREPGIALALAPAVVLWLGCVLACADPLARRVRLSRKLRGRLAARAGAVLGARLTLLAFGRLGPTVRGLDRRSAELNGALVSRATVSGALRSAGDLIFPAIVLVLSLGLFGIGSRPFDAAELGFLVMITAITANQLNVTAIAVEYRIAHRVAIERITQVLDQPAIAVEDGESPLRRRGRGKALTVDAVPVGADRRTVSFTVDNGECVALSGLTPTESRDLFTRMARLGSGREGRITIDGIDDDRIAPRDWWRSVSLVSGVLPLMPATIGTNATLGTPSRISDDERERVLRRFGISADAAETRIVEGRPLPHAQAAAVRAARCVLRQAGVVLIDDADVLKDGPILDALLDELRESGSTVILATGAGQSSPAQCRVISLVECERRAA